MTGVPKTDRRTLTPFSPGGIGPADQLTVVSHSTDGPTMLSTDSWIDLPVGYGLTDHVGVSWQKNPEAAAAAAVSCLSLQD